MAFPVGWPPRPASGVRSIRFFVSGTTAARWSDNAYLFIDDVGANTFTPMPYVKPGDNTAIVAVGDRNTPGSPMGTGANPNDVPPGDPLGQQKALIWANSVRVFNDGAADLEVSFGASSDVGAGPTQGIVKPGKNLLYRVRYEAGIALRLVGTAAVLTGGAQTFPFTATPGQTLVVKISFDSGGTYPITRTFTWPAGGVGPFANIAALVAALNTASSWDGGTLPTEFTISNTGNAVTITSAFNGAATFIKVDSTSTGIGGAANASLQFTSNQTASNGTGTASAFRVEAW